MKSFRELFSYLLILMLTASCGDSGSKQEKTQSGKPPTAVEVSKAKITNLKEMTDALGSFSTKSSTEQKSQLDPAVTEISNTELVAVEQGLPQHLAEVQEEKLAAIDLASERGDLEALRSYLLDDDAAVVAAASNALLVEDERFKPQTLEETRADLPTTKEEKLAAIDVATECAHWEELRSYLLDDDAEVMTAAFNALCAENARSATEELLAIIRDRDNPRRQQALWLLDHSPQVDQEVVINVLRDAAYDLDPPVSEYAVKALVTRNDANALSGAIGSRENDSESTRLAAVYRAASVGDDEALHFYLGDIVPEVQAGAFGGLAAKDPNAATRDLVANFLDSNKPNRWQSLQLLDESLQADEVIVLSTLIHALSDSDSLVADYAFVALTRRADPRAMDALIKALEGGNSVTWLSVIDAIENTDAGLELLRLALACPDETIRDAAAARLTEVSDAN